MVRTPVTRILVLFLVAFLIVPFGELRAQVPGTTEHGHLGEVACVDVPPAREASRSLAASTSAGSRDFSSVKHPSIGICARFRTGRLRMPLGVRVESWWRKPGKCGSANSGPKTLLRRGAKPSRSSAPCSFRWQDYAAVSLTLSCGLATVRGCIRTPAPRAGTCSRESSAWRRRLARTEPGPEEP